MWDLFLSDSKVISIKNSYGKWRDTSPDCRGKSLQGGGKHYDWHTLISSPHLLCDIAVTADRRAGWDWAEWATTSVLCKPATDTHTQGMSLSGPNYMHKCCSSLSRINFQHWPSLNAVCKNRGQKIVEWTAALAIWLKADISSSGPLIVVRVCWNVNEGFQKQNKIEGIPCPSHHCETNPWEWCSHPNSIHHTALEATL